MMIARISMAVETGPAGRPVEEEVLRGLALHRTIAEPSLPLQVLRREGCAQRSLAPRAATRGSPCAPHRGSHAPARTRRAPDLTQRTASASTASCCCCSSRPLWWLPQRPMRRVTTLATDWHRPAVPTPSRRMPPPRPRRTTPSSAPSARPTSTGRRSRCARPLSAAACLGGSRGCWRAKRPSWGRTRRADGWGSRTRSCTVRASAAVRWL